MRLSALLLATAAVLLMPAVSHAQHVPDFAATTSTAKSSSGDNSVARSNAESLKSQGLSEMPMDPFPNPEEILDADGDGIADANDSEIAIPNPFAPQTVKEDKPAKKQVYVGIPDVELRRPIQDPRIDDGYVQGLIQQRSPR